ncbi:MAG TPA: N-acetylmuramoyl-L-alanine amidase [Burkholderiaceae bacterium]|nr:N-acetylmuramoyl-L-alanine amidase [Burkholderiaceae bacterium]
MALALTPGFVRASPLLALRVWPAPEYTRVTIEHDAPLNFRHFLLRDANPLRMVVDLEGIELTPQLAEQAKRIDAADPFIARMRAGQFRPQVVRLVIELKTPVDPQVFALDPAGPYRNRLVLDLYPEGANDSLMALLRSQTDNGPETGAGQLPATDADNGIADMRGNRSDQPPMDKPSAPGGDTNAESATESAGKSAADRTGANAQENSAAARKSARAMRRLITIAVDPGHGGEDPGAIGKHGTFEKVVTLSIGRQLAALIQDQSDYRVLMTRDADYFVPLGVRVEKARRVQADLFVSIHADAWVRSDARGSSVFALSERGASSSAAAELAKQQNDADRIGGINVATRNPLVSRVLLDLSTAAQISDSLRFGDAVLHELERVNRLHRGHVEQAGFAVLKAPDIPSILVETAFISNPDEEARLRDQNYQRQMAAAVFNGIRGYFAKNPPTVHNPVG